MASELTVQPAPQPSSSTNNANQPSQGAAASATPTLGSGPDSVVIQTSKADNQGVGDDVDGRKRAQASDTAVARSKSGPPPLSSQQRSGMKTVVDFDLDQANQVYITVQDEKTGLQIAQIPSREFVAFLRERFEEMTNDNTVAQQNFNQNF